MANKQNYSGTPNTKTDMKASECKCIVCGKQAVAFWPVIDPDIPSEPYCRECLDKAKMEAMLNLQKIFDKD